MVSISSAYNKLNIIIKHFNGIELLIIVSNLVYGEFYHVEVRRPPFLNGG